MKITTAISTLLGTSLLIAGCSSSKPAPAAPAPAPRASSDVPEWIENLPQGSGLIYGSAVAEVEDMEMAKSSADARACKDVAKQLGLKVQSVAEETSQRAGDKKNGVYLEFMRQAARYIIDKDLTGCTSEKRKVQDLGGKFRVYALASLNSAKALQIANEAIAATKAQQTAVAAEASFNEAMQNMDKILQQNLNGAK